MSWEGQTYGKPESMFYRRTLKAFFSPHTKEMEYVTNFLLLLPPIAVIIELTELGNVMAVWNERTLHSHRVGQGA